MSYAADHLALATLEKIAGVQRADLLSEMIFVRAEIAASHIEVRAGELGCAAGQGRHAHCRQCLDP